MLISVAVRAKLWGFQVAKQLLRHGALHTLFTSHYGKLLGKDNSIGYNIPSKYIRTNIVSAIHTYVMPEYWQLYGERKFGEWVAQQLRDEQAIVTWGLQAEPIIKRAHGRGIKVILERGSSHVVYQRDILLEEAKLFGTSTAYLEKSFSPTRMERELWEYNEADLIVVPSAFVKRTFLDQGIPENKLFVNNFGVDLDAFYPVEKKDEVFRIIYTGQLTLRKGVHYLLQAFDELKLAGAELWLVGKKSEEIVPFLRKYSKGVSCFAPVPQNQLAGFYNRCDVFVMCSIEEGLALVQPQAMACGLPLICTTNTGGEDLITDGEEGFVLSIRNVEKLKEKLSYLYHNRDICRVMGQKSRLKVQTGYSWEDYGNRMADRYKML